MHVNEDVMRSDQANRPCSAGFRNKVVREVTLTRVPEKLVESVKRTQLSMNTNYILSM